MTLKSLVELADLGFQWVDFDVAEETVADFCARKDEIARLCKERGIRIENVTPYFPDLFSLDCALRENAMEGFVKGVELASFFDAPLVMTDTFPPPLRTRGVHEMNDTVSIETDDNVSIEAPQRIMLDKSFDWDAFWAILVNGMKQCNRICEEAGRRFCIEPFPGHAIANTDGMLRLMNVVDSDNFGAVLDTASSHYQKETVPLSIIKLGKQLFMVHVSDNDSMRNYHLSPGEGTIDWNSVLSALDMINFSGCVSVDVRAMPSKMDQEYMKTKRFFENVFACNEKRFERVPAVQ